MRIPTIRGIIDRRILVNYRIAAEVVSRLLPSPFRPKLVNGYGVGGICLIRLKRLRPAWVPFPVGLGSENAAHRFAVEWDRDGRTWEGVYIPRRDSSSRLNAIVGGRLVPGEHHHATFVVSETAQHLSVAFRSDDGAADVSVVARDADALPVGSIFASVLDASRFFEAGALGYSATRDRGRFDGLELACESWAVSPLAIEAARSSYFDDRSTFPAGSVVLDCALVMRSIEHRWHSRAEVRCTPPIGRPLPT